MDKETRRKHIETDNACGERTITPEEEEELKSYVRHEEVYND